MLVMDLSCRPFLPGKTEQHQVRLLLSLPFCLFVFVLPVEGGRSTLDALCRSWPFLSLLLSGYLFSLPMFFSLSPPSSMNPIATLSDVIFCAVRVSVSF